MQSYNKNDPQTIQEMFNSIAKPYDRANAILSFQLHKYWNRQLIRSVLQANQPHTLLDLCAGTGDIALGYLKMCSAPCQAILIDFSSNMLECAKEKISQQNLSHHHIEYVVADAHSLPLENASIDCVTLAYGIRNLKEPARALQEIYRVLKPGGRLAILELTQPQNWFLQQGHKFYLRSVLPLLGKWLTSNHDAYNYLQTSIQTFISAKEVENIMIQCGFTKTATKPLAGGIATIFTGQK